MEAFTDKETGDLIGVHVWSNNIEQIKWLLENHYDEYSTEVFMGAIYDKKPDIIHLFLPYADKLSRLFLKVCIENGYVELTNACLKTASFKGNDLWYVIETICVSKKYDMLLLLYDNHQIEDFQIIPRILHHSRDQQTLEWICEKFKDNTIINIVKNGDVGAMINLINDGLDINMHTGYVLLLCVAFEQINLIELLINNGAIITDWCWRIATRNGNLKILRLFFNEVWSKDARRFFGQYVLHGHYDCVRFLIDNCGGLCLDDFLYDSVMHPKIFDLLIQHGATFKSYWNAYGMKIELDVVKKIYNLGAFARPEDILRIGNLSNDVSIVKFAIDVGANISDWYPDNFIHKGNIEMIRMLIKQFSNVDNFLGYGVIRSQHEIVQLLLDHGAKITDKTIWDCIGSSDVEMFKLLLKFDADVVANGWENLRLAVRGGHIEVAKMLLARGVECENKKYLLSICHKLGYDELIPLLED